MKDSISSIFANWQIIVISFIIGVLITTGIYFLVKPEPEPVNSLEKALFTWGDAIVNPHWMEGRKEMVTLVDSYDLPLSAKDAVTSGWTENGRCVEGLGRYFSNPDMPNLLIYNSIDELIGVYLYSYDPMTNPWTKSQPLVIPQNITLVPNEHWSIPLYFQNPSTACGP